MEFDPFDPNPWQTNSHQSSLPPSPQFHPPDPFHHPPPYNDPPPPNPPRGNHRKPKKNHNLAVQLAITIKQMMSQHINQLGSSDDREKIIRTVWSLFIRDTRRTKEILMVMFNERVYNQALIEKYGFEQIYGFSHYTEYLRAMTQLRREIFDVMNPDAVRRHIMNSRKIQEHNRPQVIEYINAFMLNELAVGRITSRQDQRTAMIISEILNRTSREENFISAVIATNTRNQGSPHHQSIP